jgi:rhodanese-related sulfurtransferase
MSMPDYQIISAEDAQALIDAEAVTILDARDHRSYRVAHIDGARLLHDDLEQALVSEGDFDRPVLLYCYRGNDSQAKAERFVQLGFRRVYSLHKGFTAWPRRHASLGGP